MSFYASHITFEKEFDTKKRKVKGEIFPGW